MQRQRERGFEQVGQVGLLGFCWDSIFKVVFLESEESLLVRTVENLLVHWMLLNLVLT